MTSPEARQQEKDFHLIMKLVIAGLIFVGGWIMGVLSITEPIVR